MKNKKTDVKPWTVDDVKINLPPVDVSIGRLRYLASIATNRTDPATVVAIIGHARHVFCVPWETIVEALNNRAPIPVDDPMED